jgi:transketolase
VGYLLMPAQSKLGDKRQSRRILLPAVAAVATTLVATQLPTSSDFVAPAGARVLQESHGSYADTSTLSSINGFKGTATCSYEYSIAGVVGLAAAAIGLAVGRGKAKSSRGAAASCRAVPVAATEVDTECINALRFLAVDGVNKSNSGHPGAPMGQAPIGYVLFAEEMNYNPADSGWVNRDRFVLSSGHGCMLQYSLLHLAGYSSVSMDDIKQFRQWGSSTPGHPENFETDGIEVTTGPLGMGISNAVGLAIAERHLAAVYNKEGLPLIDHYTYCIAGDGCMQEGISHESCSLAGHLGLGKLIAFYDDNGITIDGDTELSFTEDVGKRFEAYGWQVLTVENGNTDIEAIRKAVAQAKAETKRPTLIKVKTTIGYGSPNKADSHDAHGAPLGKDEAVATREALGWKYGEFEVPQVAYDTFRGKAAKGASKQKEWNKLWSEYQAKHPDLAKQFQRAVMDKTLPQSWVDALPKYNPADKAKATRITSQECLNALSPVLPELLGGSADLAPSNMTLVKNSGDLLNGQFENRNMRFGIREFGMGAIGNAMALDRTGLVPYVATFLIFSDYMRNSIRLAALSQAGTIFVMTHDSVAVGEDGPTHQPIEQIPSLRMIPNLVVMRPADGNETSGAYKVAIERSKSGHGPTLMCMSRQALKQLEKSSISNVEKGAYEVTDCKDPDLILIATGSEVGLCMDAANELDAKVRVVSMPSCEVYRDQAQSYKDAILPPGVPKLSVEAAMTVGWAEFSDAQIGINVFGASAPGGVCMDKFGLNIPNVVSCAKKCLSGERGVLSDGSQAKK